MEIDLNADLGEGAGFDAELMPLITSANVCCGLHAGGPTVSRETLELAQHHRVVIGAHPGYPDREHFGRRELTLRPEEVFDICLHQIGGLSDLAHAVSAEIRYVKPHGALYNQACRDETIARAVAAAAAVVDLPLIGLPGSRLEQVWQTDDPGPVIPDPPWAPNWRRWQRVWEGRNRSFVREGFADRRYRPDGSLVPRTEPDAFVHDPDEAVKQVEWLIETKGVRTICVHGDNPQAVAFTKAVREALFARGFTLGPFA
jgi:UPF0271 protein